MIEKMIKHSLLILLVSVLVSVSCTKTVQKSVDVVPAPAECIVKNGKFKICGKTMSVDPQLGQYAYDYVNAFSEAISSASGKKTEISKDSGDVKFISDDNLLEGCYEIQVRRNSISVTASGLNGVVYAVETLKQLLPVEIYSGKPADGEDWSIPCMELKDHPRFGYRGLMLDVARHFFSIDEVKKILDVMAIHKLNKLHWHLTDDQGWRVEINKYPELTRVGSNRKGTAIRKSDTEFDGIPYGGFYTQEELKEVVEYAASKGIDIIPEIDLPGHMLAALASYPELGCTGGPYEVWGRWGISHDVLCVGKESTMKFLEDVLSEIIDIFPSEYIHIGGDECPKDHWKTCPVCQVKIRELGFTDDGEHTAEHYLQSYVTERISNFLLKHGRKIIGWDEILEGKLAEGATVMSWRGIEGGMHAAALGHNAIMSPHTYLYFDYYQSKDVDNEPFAIGGYNPIERVYCYEPVENPQMEDYILGVQANVWTEYIPDDEHLEYMILPRLAALSEVQWCQSGNKDWIRFRSCLDHVARIYDELGYNYSKVIFEHGVDEDELRIPLNRN